MITFPDLRSLHQSLRAWIDSPYVVHTQQFGDDVRRLLEISQKLYWQNQALGQYKERYERQRAKHKRPEVEKLCLVCQVIFMTTDKKKIYCSPDCAKEAAKRKAQEKKEPKRMIDPIAVEQHITRSRARVFLNTDFLGEAWTTGGLSNQAGTIVNIWLFRGKAWREQNQNLLAALEQWQHRNAQEDLRFEDGRSRGLYGIWARLTEITAPDADNKVTLFFGVGENRKEPTQ